MDCKKDLKVILIGGTHRSGSTLLDLILGSNSKCHSCGELFALVRPIIKSHYNPACSCSNIKHSRIWEELQATSNIHNIYLNIIKAFKISRDIFLIDSSKDLTWLKPINKIYKINVINILIYKDPYEYGYSIWKRNKNVNWEIRWILYHLGYLSIINNFIPIKYSHLAKNTETTVKKICDFLHVSYEHEQIRYWEKEHHIVFGSSTARRMLFKNEGQIYYDEQFESMKDFKNSIKKSKLYQYLFEKIIEIINGDRKISWTFYIIGRAFIMLKYFRIGIIRLRNSYL